jgi:hypothetical protein
MSLTAFEERRGSYMQINILLNALPLQPACSSSNSVRMQQAATLQRNRLLRAHATANSQVRNDKQIIIKSHGDKLQSAAAAAASCGMNTLLFGFKL